MGGSQSLEEGQDAHCFELTTLTKSSTINLPKDFCSPPSALGTDVQRSESNESNHILFTSEVLEQVYSFAADSTPQSTKTR
jgi:hypothetical protein